MLIKLFHKNGIAKAPYIPKYEGSAKTERNCPLHRSGGHHVPSFLTE